MACVQGDDEKCRDHGDVFDGNHVEEYHPSEPVCDWVAWMFGCNCHPVVPVTEDRRVRKKRR